VVAGAITFVALLLSEPLFKMAGLSDAVARYGYGYLIYRILGVPGVFLYWAYNGYMEGLGQTRTPMWISIAANFVNAGLDYLLIFGYGPIAPMGVEGAGLATAASNMFMLVCFIVVVHRPGSFYEQFGIRRFLSKFDPKLMRHMFSLGLPMGFQFLLEVGAFLFFGIVVGWVGDVDLAANQVALRIMSISFMTAWGISTAATTLVGRHMGEGNPDLAMQAGLKSVSIMAVYSLGFAVLLASAPALLTRIFTSDEGVIAVCVTLLYPAAAIQLFDGISVVCYGGLKGAGDTRWPLVLIIVMNWLVGVPMVYLLAIVAGLGAVGAWLGMLVMFVLQGAFMLARFRGGKWRALKLLS
jgi:MATE family multidrug resistance protein